jgi:hypothetical protein
MNEAQKEVSRKIGELMGEHFSNSLLILSSDQLDDDDFISIRFYGGPLTAAGMAEYAKKAMYRMMEGDDDPDDYGDYTKF